MILGRYLLKELGLNLKLSDNVIEADNGLLKVLTAPMVDLGMIRGIVLTTFEVCIYQGSI